MPIPDLKPFADDFPCPSSMVQMGSLSFIQNSTLPSGNLLHNY